MLAAIGKMIVLLLFLTQVRLAQSLRQQSNRRWRFKFPCQIYQILQRDPTPHLPYSASPKSHPWPTELFLYC